MRLSFFWKKQLLDVVDVHDDAWVFVSITAPAKLASSTKETVASELRIVDENGARWLIDVETTSPAWSLVSGYVARAQAAPRVEAAIDPAFSFGAPRAPAVLRDAA